MKIYRSEQPVLTASFTDNEDNSIVPPGNQAVDVPDNLWATYTGKLVELQQLENAIGEYFGLPVPIQFDEEDDSEIYEQENDDELKDKWK